MGKPSAPAAPDPVATAQAQTASNKETAVANAGLNRVDQYSPYGSSVYSVIGSNADGTPKYRQDVNLSPEQQDLYNKVTQGQSYLASTGLGMLGRVGQEYDTPLDTSSISSLNGGTYADEMQQAQDAAYRKNTQYLDPQYTRDDAALRTQLLNQGFNQGSEGYKNAYDQFNERKQQAYDSARDSAIAQGNAQQNQLFNQDSQRLARLLALRSQPLNEYNALLSGSQVTNPTFGNVPNASQANTDVAGITQQGYSNQMNRYNAQNQGINNLLGLGGTIGSAFLLSDRRLKRDIRPTGQVIFGAPIYTFTYEADETATVFRGLMADDVKRLRPDCVRTGSDGFDRVNYGRFLGGENG